MDYASNADLLARGINYCRSKTPVFLPINRDFGCNNMLDLTEVKPATMASRDDRDAEQTSVLPTK